MTISLKNRSRIVLSLFFIFDHVVWIYGGHLEQAALFYVILSECVRILAIVIVVVSYFNVKILNKSVSVLMLYCVVMGYMNFGTSSDNTLFGNAPVNMFYFKKEKNIPIIHGTFAAVYYMYMLIFSYFFAAKYISPKIIQKK